MHTITQTHIDEFDEFIAQFQSESNRAAIILGAAKIDFLLYELLSKYLVANYRKDDELLENDGPLSTFSSRICLCYRLGLINAEFARILHTIRKIRNEIAHTTSECLLDKSPFREWIKSISSMMEKEELFIDIKSNYFEDKTGCESDLFTSVALVVARLNAIYLKVKPIDNTKAFAILPKGYSSKRRKAKK